MRFFLQNFCVGKVHLVLIMETTSCQLSQFHLTNSFYTFIKPPDDSVTNYLDFFDEWRETMLHSMKNSHGKMAGKILVKTVRVSPPEVHPDLAWHPLTPSGTHPKFSVPVAFSK